MSQFLSKCIDITPNGVLRPGAFNDYRVLRLQPWWAALAATTSHLRLWADWPSLQPAANVAIDSPANPGAASARSLDEQIRLATADGLNARGAHARDRAMGQFHMSEQAVHVHRSFQDSRRETLVRLFGPHARPSGENRP
jgi:hypothetical protein